VEAIGEEVFRIVSAAHLTSAEAIAKEVSATRATVTIAIKAMETTKLVATAAEAITVDTLKADIKAKAEASSNLKRSATFAVKQDVGQPSIQKTSSKVRTTDIASRANTTPRSFPPKKNTKAS
jgi:hypothetical protein